VAQVEIEEIVDHLSNEMTRSLEQAVKEVLPEVEFDRRALFKAFKRAVRRKCNTWEEVPDQHVRV
jgi:hypothetical protein